MKISRLLPAIQMQLAAIDNSDLQHICLERFQCLLTNMHDIGNILKITSNSSQKKKLTIGECKDELMVATGQFTLLLHGEGHCRTHTVSNADADRDKTNVLRGLIESDMTPSSDHFFCF